VNAHSSIIFSPKDPIVFAYFPGKLTSYNYVTKSLKTCDVTSNITFLTTQVSCHPIENRLLYASSINTLSCIQYNNNYRTDPVYTTKEDCIVFGTYSPDKNSIFINHYCGGCCMYDQSTKLYSTLLKNLCDNTVAVDFHPYRPILAMLIDTGEVQYWNYKTKEIVAHIHTNNNNALITYPNVTQRLTFSPNGEKLAIALTDKCLVLNVLQSNLVIIYWLFKHYKIPRELIKHILQKYILTSESYNPNLAEFMGT